MRNNEFFPNHTHFVTVFLNFPVVFFEIAEKCLKIFVLESAIIITINEPLGSVKR